MQDNIQRKILDALLVALRPLARALLRAGIGYREFAEISKTAFVDIATKDYGLRGRPTNISRVAVMTGLTRKEVKRIRNKTEAGDASVVIRMPPMTELLHRWYTEDDFVDAHGLPQPLPFDGPGSSSLLYRDSYAANRSSIDSVNSTSLSRATRRIRGKSYSLMYLVVAVLCTHVLSIFTLSVLCASVSAAG